MQKVEILGVGVDAGRFDEATAQLVAWASDPTPRYVSTCPVYTLMVTHENTQARTALLNADMVAADGMPVVWVQRRRGVPSAERCYGPDLMSESFRQTAGTGVRHYLWGGAPGVPEALADTLRDRYGDVNIVGATSPPLEPAGTPPQQVHIDRINAAAPDVVWVGLGSPKQDIWMHDYRPHLDAPLLIGVGAAFDFLSGRKAQAPAWMRGAGLEWAFRLAQEPRRLARRYLVYNSLFLWRLLREEMRA